jgi:CheY-like chemotaxis protein
MQARSDVTLVLSAGADGMRRRVLLLTRLGCEVRVAANGQDAIRLFAATATTSC